MLDVVAVLGKDSKHIYYLSPNSIELRKGDEVVFETDNGFFVGTVCKETYPEKKSNLVLPLKNVIRLLAETDKRSLRKNSILAAKALEDAKKFSKTLNLNMNFVDSYLNLDGTQLMLSFMSEDRVDFRDLVKKLAQKYKMRIELRQIGVRDKAKKIGGLGPCGLFLCCSSFLTDFNSVSINMAKNQMLALNPTKINGICGRLLCCLGYENDSYTELKKTLPKVGLIMDTNEGMGKVVEIDVFANTYSVDLGDKGIVKFVGEDRNGKNK